MSFLAKPPTDLITFVSKVKSYPIGQKIKTKKPNDDIRLFEIKTLIR